MKIMGYHYGATGAWGYAFYEEQKKICTLSSIVVPSPPVLLQGFGHEWYSKLDQAGTVAPGLTRSISDHKSKENIYKIIYQNSGQYDIVFSDDHMAVHIGNDHYAFFSGDTEVAQIEKVCETPIEVPQELQYYDTELHFLANVSDQIKPEHMLAILSFPVLRFTGTGSPEPEAKPILTPMNNIEVYQDTRNRVLTDPRLRQETQRAIYNTKIYDKGFVSAKKPCYVANISFQESLTLIAARNLVAQGKRTAVLNFANPVEPGGGVLRGANAQEEYLCRASNLYFCLIGPQAKPWYDAHNALRDDDWYRHSFLTTDRVIWSKGVTVIREDVGYRPGSMAASRQEYTDDWVKVDVLTCAAPYFSGAGPMLAHSVLEPLLMRRIRNILEVAIENDVQSLVLGAFGCGAFHNPPTVVARAFQNVLQTDRYAHAFEDVVFAVKRSGPYCENIEAFRSAFSR